MTSRQKLTGATAALALTAIFSPVSDARLKRLYPLRFFSKEKIALREFRNASGAYGSSLPLEKYPRELVRAILLAEDPRFLQHAGFDPQAILRAAFDNFRQHRIRSGASTITQQLARSIFADQLPKNRLLRKIAETAIALKLSATTSKTEVLEAYLNQVAMPHNSTGLAAAAERIFGKHVTLLNNEEITALVVMVSQGTGGFRVCGGHEALCAANQGTANRRALRFAAKFHKLWEKLYPRTQPGFAALIQNLQAVSPARESYLSGSEHFITWLKENNLPAYGDIVGEVSANLNKVIAGIIRNELQAIRDTGAEQAAVVVIEITPEEDSLRAMVGSADFFSGGGGEINHAVHVRSAGSTLKPFVYALGFEKKIFAADTTFSDSEIALQTGHDHQTYRPQNNDMRFWGRLTLRESLVASRNIPALIAVQQIGVENLLSFLKRAGVNHLTQSAEHYGPGLALGSGGMTLVQMARLYAALASEGKLKPLKLGEDDAGRPLRLGKNQQLLSSETAGRITHMLTDRALRRRAFGGRNFLDFPFAVAAKTGTSKDYRDGWVAGFTPRFVVAVWVGNSRGIPMRQVSGAWGAGRIFHQVMRHLNGGDRAKFSYSEKLKEIRVCRKSGRMATAACPSHPEMLARGESTPALCPLSHAAGEAAAEAQLPVVVSPAQGERYVIHPNEQAARQEIPIIIRNGSAGNFSYALESETPRPVHGEVRDFRRLAHGDYTLRIFSGAETIDEISFSVR